jgi:hypothetical protein
MGAEERQQAGSSGNHVSQPIRGKIAERWVKEAAYYIWEKEGHPHGRDLDHWLRGENEVRRLVAAGSLREQAW